MKKFLDILKLLGTAIVVNACFIALLAWAHILITPEIVLGPTLSQKAIDTIKKEVRIVTKADRPNLIDCSDELATFGYEPLYTYPWLEFFSGNIEPTNGFLYYNTTFPLYVHISGITRMSERSPIFIGFRGDTAGVHRSLLTPRIYDLFKEHPKSVMFMPGSYIRIRANTIQSVCHRRTYPGNIFVDSRWPVFKQRQAWDVYNSLFSGHSHIYLFSYSNGAIARDEFLETDVDLLPPVPADMYADFAEHFSEVANFKRTTDVAHIDGIVDIEANWAVNKNFWNLVKYIKDYVRTDPKRIYYAACNLDSPVAASQIAMIQALRLTGEELENGIVRYRNTYGNIVIDVVTNRSGDPYAHGRASLYRTNFLRNPNLKTRVWFGHYNILKYGVPEFNKIAKSLRIL